LRRVFEVTEAFASLFFVLVGSPRVAEICRRCSKRLVIFDLSPPPFSILVSSSRATLAPNAFPELIYGLWGCFHNRQRGLSPLTMASHRSGHYSRPATLSLPPSFNLSRPILIQRLKSNHTPSPVTFSKEPMYFSIFKPTVYIVFIEYIFSFRKRRSPLLDLKYVFFIYRFATDFVLLIKTSF